MGDRSRGSFETDSSPLKPATTRPDMAVSPFASAAAADRMKSAMSGLRLALTLVDLETETILAISDAGRELLGLPLDRIIGLPVREVLDPRDRAAGEAAIEALRSGAIDFYQAHRRRAGESAPKTGFCAWVRRIDLGGRPHALIRWVDPRTPPGPWPSGSDVVSQAVAIAVTDAHGVVRDASVGPVVVDGFSLDELTGLRLVPSPQVDNLVSVADWRAASIEGVSISYVAPLRPGNGATAELEAIATALAGHAGWLVVLVRMDPPLSARETELERHLWRIAAEIEASGILMYAGTTRLSLARIPEAASLTTRQWEVLRRIVAGQRVPTIATELYVSQSTVRNHLSAIFQRFGVHSQSDLLARLASTDAPSAGTGALPMA